jgi:hypothetical protein
MPSTTLLGLHFTRGWADDGDAETEIKIYLEDDRWEPGEAMVMDQERISTSAMPDPYNLYTLAASATLHGHLGPYEDEYQSELDPPPNHTWGSYQTINQISKCKRIGSIPLTAIQSVGGIFGVPRGNYGIEIMKNKLVVARQLIGPDYYLSDILQYLRDESDVNFAYFEDLYDNDDNLVWTDQNSAFGDSAFYLKTGTIVRLYIFQEDSLVLPWPDAAWRIRSGENEISGQTHYPDYTWTTVASGTFNDDAFPVGVPSTTQVKNYIFNALEGPASFLQTMQYSPDGVTWSNEFDDGILDGAWP